MTFPRTLCYHYYHPYSRDGKTDSERKYDLLSLMSNEQQTQDEKNPQICLPVLQLQCNEGILDQNETEGKY